MDLQLIRRNNLRSLLRQWEGPTNLARKLNYAGPSYLSQLMSSKPITEKTARYIEGTLELPQGWLDAEHGADAHRVSLDPRLIARVIGAVSLALESAALDPPAGIRAELIALVYDDATSRGTLNDEFITRLINLLKWNK